MIVRAALVALLVLSGALALPGRAEAVGQCGLPSTAPLWLDFTPPELERTFGRPGVNAAVSTGDFPARLRAAGAKTVYWDMNLNNRVGTPTLPADPALIVERANRLFDFAAAQSACDKPLIALNELFGSHLETPWTATNERYRANVLTLLRRLSERGARPFLLLSTTPFTGSEEAASWWREAARYSDLVPEAYFGAPSIWGSGAIVGNRRMRAAMRQKLSPFLAIGIPPSRLGLVLGFQTAPGTGGRAGLRPSRAWFEVVKWQALAARQVASELRIASIWSWGWATYSQASTDPDKPTAACVYLWTRSPSLCDGPAAAGPGWNASLTEGQIRLPAARKCTFGARGYDSGALAALQRVTDDRDLAASMLLARVAETPHAQVPTSRVLAAERAVIALRFGGRRAAYTAALARAGATVAIARAAIGDELRRLQLERTMRARVPAASEVLAFYTSYADLDTRVVEAKPAPWWLGGAGRGLALGGVAPEELFGLPEGREVALRALDGTYRVRALGETQPLGSVPLAQARPAIAGALRAFARHAAFDGWSTFQQRQLQKVAVCRSDEVPTPGTVRVAAFLPFLSLS